MRIAANARATKPAATGDFSPVAFENDQQKKEAAEDQAGDDARPKQIKHGQIGHGRINDHVDRGGIKMPSVPPALGDRQKNARRNRSAPIGASTRRQARRRWRGSIRKRPRRWRWSAPRQRRGRLEFCPTKAPRRLYQARHHAGAGHQLGKQNKERNCEQGVAGKCADEDLRDGIGGRPHSHERDKGGNTQPTKIGAPIVSRPPALRSSGGPVASV